MNADREEWLIREWCSGMFVTLSTRRLHLRPSFLWRHVVREACLRTQDIAQISVRRTWYYGLFNFEVVEKNRVNGKSPFLVTRRPFLKDIPGRIRLGPSRPRKWVQAFQQAAIPVAIDERTLERWEKLSNRLRIPRLVVLTLVPMLPLVLGILRMDVSTLLQGMPFMVLAIAFVWWGASRMGWL